MATDAPDQWTVLFPSSAERALECLAEPVRSWFQERFGTPTEAQRMAWPALARGENLLLCSPTGSGKTLAAFAPILSQLIDDPTPGLRCLYLSPLKALANDVRKNLRRAIRGIQNQPAAGLIPAGRRRAYLRRPLARSLCAGAAPRCRLRPAYLRRASSRSRNGRSRRALPWRGG